MRINSTMGYTTNGVVNKLSRTSNKVLKEEEGEVKGEARTIPRLVTREVQQNVDPQIVLYFGAETQPTIFIMCGCAPVRQADESRAQCTATLL